MKSAYFRKPSYLIGGILICISMAAAFGSDASVSDPAAVKKDAVSKGSGITVETVTGENLKTVRLYPFDQIPDSAEIREAITASWVSAPLEAVMKRSRDL